MTSKINQLTFDEGLEERLNFFVEEFESARERHPKVDVAEFLPSEDDKHYAVIGAELLRVDLQVRWERGNPLSLPEYERRFGQILTNRDHFSDLAFEDYRMRRIAGQQIQPADYHTRYGIDTNGWPRLGDSTVRVQSQAAPTIYNRRTDGRVDTSQVVPQTGDRFLDFDLLCELGTGAFSRVFLAEQSDLANRHVVLKITPAKSSEAQQLARLQHANIVPIHSVHCQSESFAICMPYFGPCTLNDALQQSRREESLPKSGDFFAKVIQSKQAAMNRAIAHVNGKNRTRYVERPAVSRSRVEFFQSTSYVHACVAICRQIAEGLRHAHKQGIAHRDLKPANVLLASDGTVMLLDFNLSDELESENALSFVGGTLPYAAPEHLQSILSGERAGHQSDLYSMGVVLYELLTGHLPFPARTGSEELAIREMISDRRTASISVRETNSSVPRDIESIVRHLLEPDIEQRYQNADQICDDLQRHLDNRPLRFAADHSIPERIRKWARRHPRLSSSAVIGTAAIVMLIFLSAVGFLQWRRARDAELASAIGRLERRLPEIRAYTTIPGSDLSLIDRGLAIANESLIPFDRWRRPTAGGNEDFAQVARFLQQRDIGASDRLGECLYLIANAHLLKASSNFDQESRSKLLDKAARFNQQAAALTVDALQMAVADQAADIQRIRSHDNVVASVRRATGGGMLDAITLIRNRRAKEAIPLLEGLRDEEPFDLSRWFLLGNCYAACERYSEAEACFTTCAVMWSDLPLGFFQRGLCRLKMDRFPEAEGDFSEAFRRNPNLVSALINRSIARREQKKYRPACDDLDQALELDAPQTRIYFMRAELRKILGDDAGAKADYQVGMQTEPADEQSFIRRAMAFIRRNPGQAIDDLKAAAAINPRSYAAYRNLAYIYGERLNRPKDAIEILNGMEAWSPAPQEEIISRAVMYARMDDRNAAVRNAEKALQLTRAPKTVFQAACVYANTSRTNPADRAVAMALLAEAIGGDANWKKVAATDADLDPLREHDDFAALIH